MCNITLTRRRGSRPDGARYCTAIIILHDFGLPILSSQWQNNNALETYYMYDT